MQEHKSRTSVLKIKKKCSIREIKYRSGGILVQIFPFFHVSKKRKNNNSNNIVIHLVSVINHENWPKAIMKRDRYEYRKIYLDLIRYLLR